MKSTPTALKEFLKAGNRIFAVPVFQRRYDWNEDLCEVLFNDIYQTTINNSNNDEEHDSIEHFFGTIIYVEEKGDKHQIGKVILTDGQQRISTTLLFLAALRDVVEDEEFKNDLKSNFLTVTLPKQKDRPISKLEQVELDGKILKHLMLDKPIFDEKEKKTRIYKNYEFFLNKLKKLKEKNFDLTDLFYVGLEGFNLVTIQLEPKSYPWENPQDIFESMNSLGKPLSLGDLVRNYLFLQQDFKDQEKLYSDFWIPIEKKVNNEEKNNLSAFIRDYMQMVEDRSFKEATDGNAKVLYSEFKSILGNKDLKGLLRDMVFYGDLYSWITLKKESPNKIVSQVLKDLDEIKTNSARSMVMLLLGEWKKGEIKDTEIEGMLRIFRSYFLRRRILSSRSSQSESKGVLTMQKEIKEKVIPATDKIQALIDVLSKQKEAMKFPNDQEIKEVLLNMDFYKSKYSQLILLMVEEAITKARPIKEKILQREHIMPQKLNPLWKDSLGSKCDEIHEKLVNNIGNLTLIRHNQELGGKLFPEKKKIYGENSGMEIAKKCITDCDSWGENEILRRAEWLSDFIIEKVIPTPKGLNPNPPKVNKPKSFSFKRYNLIDKIIYWKDDPSITARVHDDKKVMFEDELWALSTLTQKLHERNGTVNKSGSYNGYYHWLYNGKLLAKLPDSIE